MNPLILIGSALIGLGLISNKQKDLPKKLDANAKTVPNSKPTETDAPTAPDVKTESDSIGEIASE